MSSKSTILYIPGKEHWYEESVDPRDTVAIQIEKASIVEVVDGYDGPTIYIKADSTLGQILRSPEVAEALKKLGYGN